MLLRPLALLLGLLAGAAVGAERVEVQSELLRLDDAQRQKAVADLLAPSAVRLAGGHLKLADALAALTASGNTTTADAGVDLTREADLPASNGTYWEAVTAICAAWQLEPKPGIPAGGQPGRGERGVAVQTGALELKASEGNAPLLVPDGPLLAQVVECEIRRSVGARRESAAQLTLALRLEPKVAAERVGETSVRIARVVDQQGRALGTDSDAATEAGDLPEQLRLRLRLADEPTALLLDGELKIGLVEPWHATAALRPGTSAVIACAGKTLDLRLVDAEHQGLSGGQGPLLELFFPRDALVGDPRIHLANAGKALAPRGNGASQTANGRVVYATFAALEDQPYDASVSGAARLGAPLRLDLRVPIDASRLSARPAHGPREVDAFGPTRLSWPAGKTTLKQAVARLEEGGNQVLLQLGTDEQAERELPAFTGTFWEGVLALCAAFGIDILPPTAPPVGTGGEGGDAAACLAGGPLGLGPRRAGTTNAHQACGALLIEVGNVTATASRGLGGGGRQAEAICHFRLEPRVDAEAVGACSVAANSYAADDRGRPVAISDAQPAAGGASIEIDHPARFARVLGRVRIRQQSDEEQSPPRYDLVFTAGGLEADTQSFAVTGQVRIEVQRQVRAEATLVPGVATTIPYGDGTITATLYDTNAAVAAGLRQPALGLSGQGNLMETSMQLIPPSGMALTANGHGSWTRNGRQEMLYLYPITEEGAYRLVINDTVHVADVRVPFSAAVPLPAP